MSRNLEIYAIFLNFLLSDIENKNELVYSDSQLYKRYTGWSNNFEYYHNF